MADMFSVAPGFAAYLGGQQNFRANQEAQMKQQELGQLIQQRAAEEARKAAMHPIEMEKAGLGNQELSARIPGVQADSRLKGTVADVSQATMPGQIAATNSENSDKVSKNQYEQYQRTRDVFMTSGVELESVPVPMRAQFLKQRFEAAGMNTQNPQIQQMLMQAQQNPEAFPKMIQQMGERIGQLAEATSPTARSAATVARIGAAERRYATDAQERASKYTADKSFEARTVNANSKGKAFDIETAIRSGKMSPERAAIAADLEASRATNPEEKMFWMEKARQWERFVYQRPQGGKEGNTILTPEGGLGQRQIQPALGQDGGKSPLNESTAGQTKSGVKYKIIPN
jgi:hypothetical protein